jgi:hypothetical protein
MIPSADFPVLALPSAVDKAQKLAGVRAPGMIGYASNTGTLRNLDALRVAGWRVLLTPDNPKPRPGLRYGIDNGAWKAYQQKTEFDGEAFAKLVDRAAGQADFVVVPDIVAGGMESLRYSLSWLPKLRHVWSLLLPVQDGMETLAVANVLRTWSGLGIFLGGSTEWKLKTMYGWGMVAASMGRHYHVGRVNTARRIRLAAEAGAVSFDGTSATMFSCTLPLLDSARRQPSLLAPVQSVAACAEVGANG